MREEERSAILSATAGSVAERELIDQRLAEAIRGMRSQGMAKKAIARTLSLDIKTVRKWLEKEWEPQRRASRGHVLAEYEEWIRKRFPEVGYNAVVLERELKEEGYTGSYVSVQRFVRPLREAARPEAATMRFETPPGEQAQVDWGVLKIWIGEEQLKVHLFVMVLGYSRRIFVRGYLGEKLENLLEGHEAAFGQFGGRTRTILYDNPRTIVLSKDTATGQIEWNRRFKDRMDFYGVQIRLCQYYRAQTKGKVERGVQYVKRNALAGRRFESLEALNEWLQRWAMSIADERVHGTTYEIPRERFDRDERVKMIAVDQRPPSRETRMLRRRVSIDGYVEIETNRYPVCYAWCRAEVEVQVNETDVRVVHEGESVVYPRVEGKHRVAKWDGEPRPLPRRVRSRPRAGDPPQHDPAWLATMGSVSPRNLDAYAAIAEEVGR
jgi:transposase